MGKIAPQEVTLSVVAVKMPDSRGKLFSSLGLAIASDWIANRFALSLVILYRTCFQQTLNRVAGWRRQELDAPGTA